MGRCTCWRVCPGPCCVRGCAALPGGRAPASTIRRAPPRLCWTVRRTREPRRRPPHRPWTQTPRVLNSPSTAAPPRQCGHRGRGALVVGAGPWARIAPGVDHGEGRPPKARVRRPLDGPGAHRIGDLGSSSLRGRTDRGRQVVADAAHRHAPGRITPMDHQRLARPGRRCPLSPPAAARGQPARPLGATGPEGPHLRINGPWPLLLPRAGTRRRSRPASPTTQMIGQPSGKPAAQGHSSSEADSRPPAPVTTGPARIDPLEQTVQHPRRTQLPLPHPPPNTNHHTNSPHGIDPSKSKGHTDN